MQKNNYFFITIVLLLATFFVPIIGKQKDGTEIEGSSFLQRALGELSKKNKRKSFLNDTDYCLKKKKARSKLYSSYLSKGELDVLVVCRDFFPLMTPEEINDSLRDIRKFIRMVIKQDLDKVDEVFLNNILYIYKTFAEFFELAWVDKETKAVFITQYGDLPSGNVEKLFDYWNKMEISSRQTLEYYKFYASWIDYTVVLIGANFSFSCKDYAKLWAVENLLRVMEYAINKLEENEVFGGYYQQSMLLFRKYFDTWKGEFEKLKGAESSLQNNIYVNHDGRVRE